MASTSAENDRLEYQNHPPQPPVALPVATVVDAQTLPMAPPCYYDDNREDYVTNPLSYPGFLVPVVHNPTLNDPQERGLIVRQQQQQQQQEVQNPEKTRMVASGVAGAVIGSLLMGPILGTIAGFGSAYATQKPGATGDIARAMGDVALTARDKAIVIDQEHRLVDQSKRALEDAWEQAKELDRKHRILDRIKDLALFSWRETMDFARRNMLLEKGVESFGRGFEWLCKKIVGRIDRIEDDPGNSTAPARLF
jgi:hypothetical protein